MAITLSPAQLLTLKTAINANPTWAAHPMTSDGFNNLAILLNQQASPQFTVWKTVITAQQVGQAMNSNELAGLATAQQACNE